MPIPNIFGKMANLVLGQGDVTQGTEQQIREARLTNTRREGSEGVRSLLLDFRAHLLNAVSSDIDPQPILQGFVQLDVPLKEKFISLPATELLKKNSESVDGLKHIHSGLGTIIKYAKHLIKDNRQEQWGTISFKNPIVQRKILPLNGYPQVLSQLGYNEVTESGQSFPAGQKPDKGTVVSLIADMELLRTELKIYCSGRHLHPESIGQYLPQDLRDELEERQASDLSMMESTDTWAGSTQEGHVDLKDQGPTKFIMASSQECNNNNNNNNSNEGNEMKAKTPVNKPCTKIQHDVTSQAAVEASTPQNIPLVVEEAAQAGHMEANAMGENKGIPDLVSNSEIAGQDMVCENPSDTSTPNKLLCSVCGEEAVFLCRECYDNQMALCEICNKSWHKRQDRRHHNPQPISRNHRSSLESSGSLPSSHLHFDEHYGITAASRQSRGKQEQTSLVKMSKFDHPTQPASNQSVLLDQELGYPQDAQTGGFHQNQQQQNQALYDPMGSNSPYQFQQPSQQTAFLYQGQMSHNNQQLQHQMYKGHNPYQQQQRPLGYTNNQHMYRGHDPYHQQHQLMTGAYRLHGQSPLFNPSAMLPMTSPSTPRFSQPQGSNMNLTSSSNSNTELVGMSHQFHGLNTITGGGYPTSVMEGARSAYPLMTLTGDGQRGLEHHFQQQQQRPSLPSYVQAQLSQTPHLRPNNIQTHMPRMVTHSPMSLNYPHQFRPRFSYPYHENTMNGTHPAQMYAGVPNVNQHAPYSMQHMREPRHPLQSPPHQSMLLQNQQPLHNPGSLEQGLRANHMDMSLQQNAPPDFTQTSTGPFSGLGRPNSDVKLGHSTPAFSKSRNSNGQRDVEAGSQNANPNAQRTSQLMTPVRNPYSDVKDSSESQSQSPFISASSSPLSTPPPSSQGSSSEYITKLKMEQDLTKRINMCDHFIRNITADTIALHKEMLKRMEGPGYFHTTPECWEMHRRMEEMVKEKSRLQIYKEKLDSQVRHFYNGVESGNMEPQIFYPPDLTREEGSKIQPVERKGSSSINIVQGRQEQLNVIIDNSQVPAQHPSSSEAPGSVLTVTNVGQKARVPVEDSIGENIHDNKDPKVDMPPVIPPRSSKPATNTNPLAMTIPAPNIPRSPSPTPRMWVCQHCTLLNPLNVHACQVCHRTSDNPKLVNGDGEDCCESGPNHRESLGGREENEEEEKSDEEDSGNEDKFIAYLAQINNEVNPKKPNLLDEDDDDDDDDLQLWEIKDKNDERQDSTIGQRIIGSQKQVMEEKKRAKLEFELREQQEALMATANAGKDLKEVKDSKSTTLNPSSGNSSSTSSSTSSPSSLFGVGARPKNNKKTPFNPAINNIMNDNNQSNKSIGEGEPQRLPFEHLSDKCHKPHSDSIQESLARMEELKSIESLQASGAQLTQLIKMADLEDFDIQAVQIAIEICESMKGKIEPLAWLRTNWRKNVAKIATQACKLGKERSPNSVGEVSFEEAEVAYITCQGNMKEAAEKCVQDRQALYEKLSTLAEDFPREEILEAMLYCKGDSDSAQARLVKAKLEPFADRIWQQSTDVKNTSGLLSSKPVSSASSPSTATLIQGIMWTVGKLAVSKTSKGSPTNLGAVNMVGINPGTVDPCQCFATSVIGHQQFQDMMRDKSMDKDRRVRMIYVEGRLHSWGRADMVIKILDEERELQQDLDAGHVTLEDVVEAVRDCQNRNSALAYLRQECQICFGRFPMNKIHNLNICQCRLCQECLVSHFEVAIRERHVRHWVCPQCSQPDLSDLDVASNYLQFLGMQLQPMISKELHDLFETKFRDWHLQKMDYFRWCAHCAEGFLAENQGDQLMMTCPRCGKKTCFKCKKQWEDQHEGLTCEEFSQWKVDNDPSNQSVGLAKHLDENGIDCPNCKMRFALAKGGCMHFKCPQCGHEFCSGCNEAYHHKNMCTKYKLCKNLGLHCHCPRDCFSFLRDYTVDQLQTLLKEHNVKFNVAPPADQQDRSHCPVMEQKEFDGEANRDEKCGRDALQGGAGLCESHYKEYLVVLINGQSLDPVSLMTKDEMETLLSRYDLQTPPVRPRDSPEVYKTSLVKIIKEKLPLRGR